eukprot:c21887_g1_i1 orf=441-1763(-)
MGSSKSDSPLLTWRTQDEDEQEGHYEAASSASAIFSFSTTIVGAGIMGLPATIQIVGFVPGFILIVFVALLTNKSIDFLIKYSNAAKSATYGGLMEDSFGHIGRIILHACIIISSFGTLVVYLIIMADVLSGTTSASVHHTGVLEEWAGGSTWWNKRSAVMAFTTVFVLAPLVCFRRIESLKVSSAVSVVLAILFVVSVAAIAIWKLINGDTVWLKFFPDFSDSTTDVFSCFSVVPVVVTAFVCHQCVHPILSELDKNSNPQVVVRIALALCMVIYLATSLFGYLLFGEDTESDVLSNFDADLGVSYSAVISAVVRVGYVIHLMLVFPLLHFALRLNLDGLIFPRAAALVNDTQRFFLITVCTMAVCLLGACFIPDIWDVFQVTGTTSAVVMCFVFPAILLLRDSHCIATRGEKWTAWFMVVVAVVSSIIALTGDILDWL